MTQDRTSAAPGAFREEAAWPPAGMREERLRLGRGTGGGTLVPRAAAGDASFTDTGASSEELAMRALDAEASWLAYRSAPVRADLRLAGTPRLELSVTASADHAHLTPTLVDIAPDGTATAITRGFLNLRYRNGLASEDPLPAGEPVRATVAFSPQDHTVQAGHRVGLVLAGSNVVWAVPDAPAGTRITVHHGAGGSQLVLPVAQ
jgi:predicted acyl esterase